MSLLNRVQANATSQQQIRQGSHDGAAGLLLVLPHMLLELVACFTRLKLAHSEEVLPIHLILQQCEYDSASCLTHLCCMLTCHTPPSSHSLPLPIAYCLCAEVTMQSSWDERFVGSRASTGKQACSHEKLLLQENDCVFFWFVGIAGLMWLTCLP